MMRPTRANKPNGYLLGSYRIATAPSRTPAGSRASSRYASIAPRTTSARGPLAWGAPRTRTHRSIRGRLKKGKFTYAAENHPAKIKRSRTRLQLVLCDDWHRGVPLLCARGSAFLMRCLRVLFHEETALLSVRKFPFLELTPSRSSL
jgi:hypothetical protein